MILKQMTKQNEEAVNVNTSRYAANVDGREVAVDGKSLNEENLKEINGELDQDISEVKPHKLKQVEDF